MTGDTAIALTIVAGVVGLCALAWLYGRWLATRPPREEVRSVATGQLLMRCTKMVALMPQDTPGDGQPILSVRCALPAYHVSVRDHLIDPADLYELGLVRPPF